MENRIDKAFTHAGKFHADDVFSAALLTYMYPEIVIERGFTVPENYQGLVFDIGFGEFDHHQEDKRVRENGVPYAAFGLLWEKFGAQIVGEEEAKRFDEKFIQALDYSDNTGEYSEVTSLISLFNPSWDSKEDPEHAFFEAVLFAKRILELKFKKIESIERAKDVVEEAMKHVEDNIMVMEIGAPWKQQVIGTEIEFVVTPSQRGGFNAQGVPVSEDDQTLKIAFPEEWRGKTKEVLPQISGIETLHFCHNSGFLIATMTKEDAIKACKIAKKTSLLAEN